MEVRRRGPEVPFESAEGVRFATMVELTDENFADGMRLLRDVRSGAVKLSALNDANAAEEIRRFFRCAFPLRKGVPDIQVDWVSLAAEYCPRGDILIRASGNWDELECSLDFIGEAEQIRLFHQEAKDDEGIKAD
jgi:hypothetical protein